MTVPEFDVVQRIKEISPNEALLMEGLKSKEDWRLFLQAFYKYDFYSFVRLLGYNELGMFHGEQIKNISKFRFIKDFPVRRLWLWFRGAFKTSLITEAHTLWLIVNNPNVRGLIVANTLEIAKKPLGAVRNHFLANENFRYIFKEFCPKVGKEGKVDWGTAESLTVNNRTIPRKEPTVMCAGIGTNITGLHFDFIKIDDIVTKESVSNDTQIQASKDYYSLLRPLYDNPTLPREDVVGTIYHFNDLHSDLRKNPEFEKSIIPVHTNQVFVFPERIDSKGFEGICADPSMNPYDIQSQYILNPINPADAKFKEEWWKTYQVLPEGLAEYICVDPASTQKKKSDYTVIERWGVDWENKHYLIEGYRDRLTAFQRLHLLLTVAGRSKNLKFIKYEVLGGRHGDLEMLKERMRENRVYYTVKETKSTSVSKADRIEQRLVAPWHAGVIFMPQFFTYRSEFDGKTHDFAQDYRLEFLQFPFSEHDDILDCHSQMFEEELIKGKKSQEPSKDDSFEWWRQLAINAHRTAKRRFVFGSKHRPDPIPAKIAPR